MDVVDVSKSLIELMSSEVVNERYIINSENLQFRTVFDWIAEDLDKPKASIKVTPLLKEIVWRLEGIRCFLTKKTPLITKETANQAMAKMAYSNKKISDFGFKHTPIRESIKKYSEWFLNDI